MLRYLGLFLLAVSGAAHAAPSETPAPTPAAPTPAPVTPTSPAPTPAPAPAPGSDAANATLGPPPADPGTSDELTVAPKPEAYIEGEGSWDEALATGTGFPRVFYLKYHLYRNSFPVLAMSCYLKSRTEQERK